MGEITTREAIKTYDVAAGLLYRWLSSGEVNARKTAEGVWMIRRDSIEKRNQRRLAWRKLLAKEA